MMKYLIIILFLLIGFFAKSQQTWPAGTPTQFSTGYFRHGYDKTDSGTIVALRDTTWLPKFSGTIVFRPQTRLPYYYDSVALRWFPMISTIDTTSLSNRINLKLNISDTAAMLLPYLRKADTTNKWVQNIYARNDSLFKQKNGTETFVHTFPTTGTGTVTSVALSMPAAFTVTGSPITTSGTFNVSGSGTSLQYIRGNGTLATFDTTAIPNFYLKVRGLFSATSPITFNSTTGIIGLADQVTAGSCSNCNITFNSKGQATIYSSGSAGGTFLDTALNGLTKLSDTVVLGGTLDRTTDIANAGNSFTLHGAGDNILRTTNGNFQSTVTSTSQSASLLGNNSSTNFFSEVNAIDSAVVLNGGKNGVFYNQLAVNPNSITLTTKFNTTPKNLIFDGNGYLTLDAYPSLTEETDTTTNQPMGINRTTGKLVPMANWIGGGGGSGSATLNNIGAGFRWAATPSGNIKTAFGNNTITIDSSSNSNALTIKADTSNLATKYDLTLKPNVFNVVETRFGAKGDGKKIFDGAITASTSTLTSATANFTSADVGKAIRVPYAGTAGVDLITTIAGFTNSTTVTLTAAAATTVSADTVVWGTDNTVAFQKALDTCYHFGGGTVYIPNGVYMFAGPLRNGVNGTNPNSQLVIPTSCFGCAGDTSFNNRTQIALEGETGPEFTPNLIFDDSTVSWKGTVLYSLINGNGTNAPALIGTKSRFQASDSINYNTPVFKNLTILVSKNLHGGGPSIGGINCYYCSSSIGDNVMVTIDGSIRKSIRPTNDVAGIITNKVLSETMTKWSLAHVAGFKYGICVADHADLDQCEVYISDNAFVFMHNVESAHINRCLANWNINSVYVPDANIMGLNGSGNGASYFKIDNMQVEVWDGDAPSPSWYNYAYIVKDIGNFGIAELTYNIGKAGCCIDNTLFNKNNGTSIICTQLGIVPWANQAGTNNIYKAITAGNVGIGKTNPTAHLDILGSTSGLDGVNMTNSDATGQAGFTAVNDAGLSGGIRMKGSSSGTYGAYVANSTVYYSPASGGMHLMLDANADITFSAGSGGPPPVRLRIAGATGAVTFNNAFTFPAADGTSGQVLQTNGSGTVSWQTPSGATTIYNGDGTLSADRNVSSGGFTLRLAGTNNSDTIMSIVNNGTSGVGLYSFGSLFGIDAQSTNVGLRAFGTSNGIISTGDNNEGAIIKSNTIRGATIQSVPTSTNTVQEVLRLERGVNGSPGANGIGGSMNFYNKRTDNTSDASNTIVSKFTDAVAATLTSQLYITGVNSGTPATIATFDGNGNVTFGTTNSIVGTSTNNNAVAGNIGENAESYTTTYTNYTTSATYQAIDSITLTAGDWFIDAQATFSTNGATITGSADAIFVISTTRASASGALEGKNIAYISESNLLGTNHESISIAPYRVSLSSTTKYYLNSQATFTVGNPQYVGGLHSTRAR